ncbi:MAG TPA: hypothetical protein VMQ40_07855 [Acidimicrobiales bacterium]|jgi:hypothetical protein|nr:hypothetical protein [Acidimicrobiales bacterium]
MAAPEISRAVPVPPPSRRVSILPAASVLGLAVLTLVLVLTANAFDSSIITPTTAPVIIGALPSASAAADTSLFPQAVQDGVPPANIASALIAPKATTRIRALDTGGLGTGDYDRATSFSVAAPRARLFGFYRSNLEALGWKLISTGAAPAGGGDELLFLKGGTDGWYWETGVIAQPTTSGRTVFTFRIFQVADAS